VSQSVLLLSEQISADNKEKDFLPEYALPSDSKQILLKQKEELG
jgi:hypothetical protein